MRLNMHGAFPVEAVTIPPLNVVSYHSAPRDPHHWIVSQVMKTEVAYPVITGLSKVDAKILASAIGNVLCTGVHATNWWQCYPTLEHLQIAVTDLVVEIMSSSVSDDTKQRFNNTGEIVEVIGTTVLLWNADGTTLPSYDPVARTYSSLRKHLSRWVFTMENWGLVKKTLPEVWVQQVLTGD